MVGSVRMETSFLMLVKDHEGTRDKVRGTMFEGCGPGGRYEGRLTRYDLGCLRAVARKLRGGCGSEGEGDVGVGVVEGSPVVGGGFDLGGREDDGDDVSYVAFRDAFSGGSVGPSFFLFPVPDVLGDPRGAEGCGVVRAEGAADVEPCRGEVPGSGVALGGVFVLREVDASPGSRLEDGGRAAGVESAAVVEEDGNAVFIDGVGGVGGVVLPVSEPLFEGGGGGRFNV